MQKKTFVYQSDERESLCLEVMIMLVHIILQWHLSSEFGPI